MIAHYVHMLLSGAHSAGACARLLGEPTRAFSGSGELIRPFDEQWAEMFLGADRESGSIRYLQLIPRVPSKEVWGELCTHDGRMQRLPVRFPGTCEVMFAMDQPRFAAAIRLFVTLDHEPDHPEAAAVALLIRRDDSE
jgi:hypothetical protein